MKNLLLSALMFFKKAICSTIWAFFCRTLGHRPYIVWVTPIEGREKDWKPRVRTFCTRCSQPLIWTYHDQKELYELSEETV